MKYSLQFILYFVFSLFTKPIIAGGPYDKRHCPPRHFDAVRHFHMEGFVGKWFIQAQMPTLWLPENWNYCSYANFSVEADFSLSVFQYANINGVNGEAQFTLPRLKAVAKNPLVPSKLSLGPPQWPHMLFGSMWVVATSDINPATGGYDWAILTAGEPRYENKYTGKCIPYRRGLVATFGRNEGFWFYTRTPIVDIFTLETMKTVAWSMGLDVSVLNPVFHFGCHYNI